mgnify:CR=1 FL=1
MLSNTRDAWRCGVPFSIGRKNKINPRNVFKSSGKKFLFNCDKSHEFNIRLNDIVNNYWCPHCVSFKPTFESVASDLAGTTTKVSNKKLRFEKIDCVALAPLAKKYGVQGYPTIKIIRGSSDMNNDMDEYTGSRDETTFSEYLMTL